MFGAPDTAITSDGRAGCVVDRVGDAGGWRDASDSAGDAVVVDRCRFDTRHHVNRRHQRVDDTCKNKNLTPMFHAGAISQNSGLTPAPDPSVAMF